MSLKSMLSGKSESDKEFQTIIREDLPAKGDFQTVSGNEAFSSYMPLAPYHLSNQSDAGVVGVAFDYLARSMIAQTLNDGKEDAFIGLAAYAGLDRIEKQVDPRQYERLTKKYIDVLVCFISYIYSNYARLTPISKCNAEESMAYNKYLFAAASKNYQPLCNIETLINGAYYFAKLEQVYRSGGILPDDIEKSFFTEPNNEIKQDLIALCEVFKSAFIGGGLVKSDSIVVFNPRFGIGSIMCGGADADVWVDGILYDFKSSKSTGYKWKEVAQIMAYYYLNDVAGYGHMYDLPAPLMNYTIPRVAFYKARYGEVEYYETEKLGREKAISTVEKLAKYFKEHPENMRFAILSFILPLDATPEIFDAPYPFID